MLGYRLRRIALRCAAAVPCHVCETCGRPLDTLCVYKGGCVHAHHSGRAPPLPSCRVIRMSGLGDRFDALCADGRRPLSPCWLIRMSGHGDPFDCLCVDGRGLPCRPGNPDVGPGWPAGWSTAQPSLTQVTSSDHRPPARPTSGPLGLHPARHMGEPPVHRKLPPSDPRPQTPGYTGDPGPCTPTAGWIPVPLVL